MILSTDDNENFWRREYGSVLEFGFLNFNMLKSKPVIIDASFLVVYALTILILLMNLAAIYHSNDMDVNVECGQRILVFICSILIMSNFAVKRAEFFKIIGILKYGLSSYNHIDKARELHTKRLDDERIMQRKYNATFFVIFLVTVTSPIMDELTGSLRKNHNGIHYNFPLPLWSPIDLNSSWSLYAAFYFVIIIAMATLCSNVVCFQYVIVFICNRIILEMELLIYSIENLKNRVVESKSTTNRRSADYSQCITLNMEHYDRILRVYKRIRRFLNYTLVGPLAAGSLIVALGAISAVSMDNGSRIGPKVINLITSVYGLFYFYLIQSYFELIQSKNEKVRHAFYSTEWYAMPSAVGKSVLFTLTATNKPLEFRCVKMFLVDSRIIARIVQTSFSFMNLMIAMKEKNK